MIELKKILVPTDFSDHSHNAIRYGCELAFQFGAELHLVHVLQDVVSMAPEPGLVFTPSGDYMDELRKSAEEALEQLPDFEKAESLQVVRGTREGSPFLEILRYAKEHEIDLIVMATHGRTGLTHVLLGSVTEKVVRKAACPVLTVRLPEHEFVMP